MHKDSFYIAITERRLFLPAWFVLISAIFFILVELGVFAPGDTRIFYVLFFGGFLGVYPLRWIFRYFGLPYSNDIDEAKRDRESTEKMNRSNNSK